MPREHQAHQTASKPKDTHRQQGRRWNMIPSCKAPAKKEVTSKCSSVMSVIYEPWQAFVSRLEAFWPWAESQRSRFADSMPSWNSRLLGTRVFAIKHFTRNSDADASAGRPASLFTSENVFDRWSAKLWTSTTAKTQEVSAALPEAIASRMFAGSGGPRVF